MSDLTTVLQAALAPAYALERELAGGGMSRVFVATDVALGRKVVVKVLPPELAAGVNHERFRREIQVAAQLQHPHVVPLLSAGEQGTLIWYTMPFINGESLRETIARGQHLTVKEIVRIMRDVAEALDHAHGLGVIHRDIKPGNVLLMGSHALVTDFGVAKAISVSMPSSGFTSAGMAIGTPAYMAPEQIAADPAADHRMDLYALGLLAYEMLTGQVPFKEDSPQKTMAAQLTRDPSPVESSRADVPAALAALVRHLLAKVPDDRPQLAAEVVQRLDAIAEASGPIVGIVRTRRPSAVRTVTIVAVAVGVVGAAWLLGERTGTEAGTALVRDSLIAAESAQVMASASALLTREDSMAIARAVTARVAERPPPARPSLFRGGDRADSLALVTFADSIRVQIQRAVLDSLVLLGARGLPAAAVVGTAVEALSRAAEAIAVSSASPPSAPPSAPSAPRTGIRSSAPRRVIVAQPHPSRGRPEMDAIVSALADSLRGALDAHPRYLVVPADSVALALGESRTVNALQERLNAELVVSISLIPAGDTVIRTITVRDIGAGPGAAATRVVTSKVAPGTPSAGMSALVSQVVRALMELERSARARPAGTSPPPAPTTERPRPRP